MRISEHSDLLPHSLVDEAPGAGRQPRFFRDRATWRLLEAAVLPDLLKRRPDQRVRIWCSGPDAQDDALSALILATQIMGREAAARRIQIFATDTSIAQGHAGAGYGRYTSRQLQTLPARQRDACFKPAPGFWSVRPELRDVVVSGQHDPARNAPLTGVDLLLLSVPLEAYPEPTLPIVLNRLHFGLVAGGCLAVRREHEGLLEGLGLFEPVLAGRGVFRKVGRLPVRALKPELIALERPSSEGHQPAGGRSRAENDLRCEMQHATTVELQAMVDELQAQNRRLQLLSEELALSNARQASELCTLRSGLAQVTAALRVLPYPVVLLRGDGSVMACSAAAAELLGHRADELAEQPPEQLLDGVAAFDQGTDQDGAPMLRFRHRNGGLCEGMIDSTTLNVGGERCWLLTLRPEQPEPAAVDEPAADGGGQAAARALPALDELTPRERDVLHLLLDGQQSKQIAHALGISRRTVDVHRSNVIRKTGSRNLASLLRLVIDQRPERSVEPGGGDGAASQPASR